MKGTEMNAQIFTTTADIKNDLADVFTGAEPGDYWDIDAIIDEVYEYVPEVQGFREKPEYADNPGAFWEVAERYELPRPNAIYYNSDGSAELVELDETDAVTAIVKPLTAEEAEAIEADEDDTWRISAPSMEYTALEVGDGDTYRRIALTD